MTVALLDRPAARVTEPVRRPGYAADHVHAMVVEPGRGQESDPTPCGRSSGRASPSASPSWPRGRS